MTVADIPLGLKLARQAGWNQMESDWRRFLSMQPEGCFVGELNGVSVATTAAFIFGPVAWIAMVLVDIDSRRKGIATTLLKHALDFLDKQGVKTVRLDATAAGQPVYEKLGFVPEYPLARYQGSPPISDCGLRIADSTRDANPQSAIINPQLKEVATFDHWMTGTPREKMLIRLFEESPEITRTMHRDGQLEGYITGRRGANATLIGPCIATAYAGPTLLGEALSRCSGQPVFIDIPQDNAPAIEIAEKNGLSVQRHFMRMCRGERIADHVEAIWASSGPEKG
ncbi:MAG: GNAT family N-acetyltransferase [Phycisphaerae bacterium]|nr:GNAT family N-acetyltransferase [Phycisphaerae bacterium]